MPDIKENAAVKLSLIWTVKGRKDRGSENSKIDLAKTYAHAAQDVCGVINVGAVGVIGHGGRAY